MQFLALRAFPPLPLALVGHFILSVAAWATAPADSTDSATLSPLANSPVDSRADASTAVSIESAPTEAEVRAAMARAADFMMERLSTRDGFVWKMSLDGTDRYGELKARDSMIWVEPPGTPTVGMAWIAAFEATGDRRYLEYAERVADALVAGQLDCGGWHYFIDFEPEGLPAYYDSYFSRLWAWQEFLHYYGNATFDDEVTASATRFLLRLQATPAGSKVHGALRKALDFVLRSQHSSGGWPQRWPPQGEFSFVGHPDYSSCLTFNDGVIAGNIRLLLEAARAIENMTSANGTLDRGAYGRAARRGIDYYRISQLPEPQAGWAQQYNDRLKPAWGRSFEPPSVCSVQTMENILDLLEFYQWTGDRQILEPVSAALRWLERAEKETDLDPPFTHTCFYELETNRPLFMRRSGNQVDQIRFDRVYDAKDVHPYGVRLRIDVETLRQQVERVRGLQPVEALALLEAELASARPRIKAVSPRSDCRVTMGSQEEIALLIESLGEGDGWIVENEVLDLDDFEKNPPLRFQGYDTGTYVARIYRLIDYLQLSYGKRNHPRETR